LPSLCLRWWNNFFADIDGGNGQYSRCRLKVYIGDLAP
jgi:hypothetical protein